MAGKTRPGREKGEGRRETDKEEGEGRRETDKEEGEGRMKKEGVLLPSSFSLLPSPGPRCSCATE
jgi:hypothetical protein